MGKLNGIITNISKDKNTGVVQLESGKEIPFEQPYGKNLELDEKAKVEFDVISVGKGSLAVSVILSGSTQKKGIVIDIEKDGSSGFLLVGGKEKLPFEQPYLKQLRIQKKSEVYFSYPEDVKLCLALSLV